MSDFFTFSVDAALLREFGERLVGRHPIALAELIKNAYDADAETCLVRVGTDEIVVSDDGHGMDADTFERFWMRVGSTHKFEQRVSPQKGRQLTGAKGIGRLAVQFLARHLVVYTKPAGARNVMVARISWDKATSYGDLTSVKVRYRFLDAGKVEARALFPSGASHGTRLVLRGLRHRWADAEFEDLAREVWMLRSPLRALRSGTRDTGAFEIDFDAPGSIAARRQFESVFERVLDNWNARIVGKVESGRRTRAAHIEVTFKPGHGADHGETYEQELPLPLVKTRKPVAAGDLEEPDSEFEGDENTAENPNAIAALLDDVRFDIRIFGGKGRQAGRVRVEDFREFMRSNGGVHIYDADFHLTYYGTDQDWLSIEADHARRLSRSRLLPSDLQVPDMLQDLPTNRRIFGVVDVSTGHEERVAQGAGATSGEWLAINIGRDRLVENAAYEQLKDLVRWSIDYYASRYRARSLKRAERERPSEPAATKQVRALEVLERSKAQIPAPVFQQVTREVRDALQATEREETYRRTRAALLAPLAAAGMSAVALTHEVFREARAFDREAKRLRALAGKHGIEELQELAASLEGMGKRLRDLVRLFAPLASEADRTATRRLRARAVLSEVAAAMEPLTPNLTYDFSGVPRDMEMPEGSYAEWSALFQNLFSNAWNAMLDVEHRQVSATGGLGPRGWHVLRISDTGKGLAVPLAEADKLFEPFERRELVSEERRSLAVGGQGMGLAIVRMIAAERGCKVAFVAPEPGKSTTVELRWSGS